LILNDLGKQRFMSIRKSEKKRYISILKPFCIYNMSNRLLRLSSIKFTFSFLFIFIMACSSNEDIVIDNDDDQITEEIEEPEEEIVEPIPEGPSEQEILQSKNDLLQLLTENTLNNGVKKTWHISSASLVNATGTLDINANSSILDDEFIFTSSNSSDEVSGILTWKKRKGINHNADANSSIANDNYSSPVELDFIINDNIEIVHPEFTLIKDTENTISGEIIVDEATNSKLMVSLVQKNSDDYKIAPTNINFKSFANFNNITSYGKTTGFVGSNNTNSLYLSYRDDSSYPRVRRVYKYDINSQVLDSTEITYTGSEFTSSRLHLIDDQLVVVGSGRVSTMKNTLDSEISTYPYASNLSRAGSAAVDSQVYLLGGDLTVLDNPKVPFKIRSLNNSTYDLQDVFTIEESRTIAEGEIVDSDLYVFGGLVENSNPFELIKTGFKYNLDNGSLDYFDLPKGIFETTACRYENLIFVSGKLPFVENEPNFFFGVLNVETNSFIETSINFESIDPSLVDIEGLTIVNDTLYIAVENISNSKIVVEYVDLNSL